MRYCFPDDSIFKTILSNEFQRFCELWIAFWGIVYQEYELAHSTLLEIEKINKELKDELIGYQLDAKY